jgi:hypothetical protein
MEAQDETLRQLWLKLSEQNQHYQSFEMSIAILFHFLPPSRQLPLQELRFLGNYKKTPQYRNTAQPRETPSCESCGSVWGNLFPFSKTQLGKRRYELPAMLLVLPQAVLNKLAEPLQEKGGTNQV